MKFIIVLVTVFSVCCCFPNLNIFPLETTVRKFHLVKRALLNNIPTDEEILRCRYFMDKIVEDLNQIFSQEELEDNLSKCILLLPQSTKLSDGKDYYNIDRSPPFENNNSPDHVFIANLDSTTGSSEEVNSKNTEKNEILSGTFGQYEVSREKIFKSTTESSGLWSFFFVNTGSSDNSSPVLVTKQNEASSTEKKFDKPENQKMKNDTAILSPINSMWSLWSFLSGARDSSDSSKANRSEENFEKNQIAESGIHFENSTNLQYTTTEITAIWNIVMPGTKWCGSGSIAKNDDDLGYFEDVDRCCRAHDLCGDIMVPGESKYNLTNTSPFTVLNCKCDSELYDCLSQINSVASNAIGNTFFNIFARMCYTLDYPRKCKRYSSLLSCLEYEIDITAEKVYQWKPAKKYLKMPFPISR